MAHGSFIGNVTAAESVFFCFVWEDNIKTGLRETGWDVMYRLGLAQDRDMAVMNTVMNPQVL